MRRLTVLLVLLLLLGACSSAGSEQHPVEQDEESFWYNAPYLRPLLGDFEEAARISFSNPEEVAQLQQRGEYLVKAAACGTCHGARPEDPHTPLSGGRLMSDSFGLLRAANITPDVETGIGEWHIGEIMRAIRVSIDRHGRPLSLDLHRSYRWLCDRDTKAIVVYLLSEKPTRNTVERRQLGPFERNSWGIVPQHREFAGYVPDFPNKDETEYGRYLTHTVSQCRTCHTQSGGFFSDAVPFAGHEVGGSVFGVLTELFSSEDEALELSAASLLSPEAREELAGLNNESKEAEEETSGELEGRRLDEETASDAAEFPVVGPDIRGSSSQGLASWTVDGIVHYLSSGDTPDGEARDGTLCPWPYYREMTDEDKKNIALYLQSF